MSRRTNFTFKEVQIFLSLIQKYPDVVVTDLNPKSIQKRNEAWQKITEEFIIQSGSEKSTEQLKIKFKSLKHAAKQELNRVRQINAEIGNEGDVIKKELSAISKKVLILMQNDPLQILTGQTNEDLDVLNSNSFLSASNDESDEVDNFISNVVFNQENNEQKSSAKENDDFIFVDRLQSKRKSIKLKNTTKRCSNISRKKPKYEIKFFQELSLLFKDEHKRAVEKHKWEKEEHQIKLEILKLEREIKTRQLQDF